MYRRTTLLFLLFVSITLLAQTNANDGEQVCKQIYAKIVMAIGNNSPIPPQFVYDVKGNDRIAYIRNNKIHFEKATYDALSALGDKRKDGIAFILAHELAHHYLNHRWMKVAGYAYTSSEIGNFLKEEGRSKEQNKMQEAQADFYAGFYSHIAGYNSMPIAGNVLDIIYSQFNIDSNIVGYPSLSERKLIVKERLEEHKNLIRVFDAANIAFLIGDYTASSSCYEYILNNKFTSREIFNNLGLSQLYSSLYLLNKTDFRYYLPTTLDDNMRGVNSSDENLTKKQSKEKAKEILEISLHNFNTSLLLDKEYLVAKKNRITVLVLLSSIDSTYQSQMFQEIENVQLISKDERDNLLGIYYAISGNSHKAKKYFKKSVKSDNLLAKLNIGKLQDSEESTIKYESNLLTIDSIDLEDVVFRGEHYRFKEIPNVKLEIMSTNNSIIYKFNAESLAQKTKNLNFITEPSIDLNTSIEELIEEMGSPRNIVSSFSDINYIYETIIYIFDKSTKKLTRIISFY